MGKNQIVGKLGLFIDSDKISQILIGLLLCGRTVQCSVNIIFKFRLSWNLLVGGTTRLE